MKKRLGTMFAISAIITVATVYEGLDNQDMTEPTNHFWSLDPMKYNTYTKGQCTHYVFEKVREDGMKIGKKWNDAKYWGSYAQKSDYKVNQSPKVGSILQTTEGEYGHVAYIEQRNDNGSLEVSEMNYNKPFEISNRIITKDEVKDYKYIHPKKNASV